MSKHRSPSLMWDDPFGSIVIEATNSANALNIGSSNSTATATADQTINVG